MAERFDYVVIGSGSAGAVVATRLAERIPGRVLLLEAGAPHENDFWIRVPIGLAKILGSPKYVWKFNTEPQAFLSGQRIYWPRGKLPGGSSSVNGMIFVRGDPAEFDRWRDELGNRGWGYDDLLPYFKKFESTAIGDSSFRGREGPVPVCSLGAQPDELSDAFLSACEASGVPRNADYNGAQYEGVGYLQLSTHRARRASTATGYLHRTQRENFVFRTEALATRVLLEGRKAVGVEYRHGGALHTVYADREVIVSAGPIKSPQLLELSGIGDGPRLQRLGIATQHHLPGVGENLIDHVQSRLTFECKLPITLNEIMQSPWRQLLMGAKFMLTGKGLMATATATVHALARPAAGYDRPAVKIQLHHLSSRDRFEVVDPRRLGEALDKHPGFSIGFFQLRPDSRGGVHIRTPDPNDDPAIDPHYLEAESDQRTMIDALKLARRVSRQPSLAPYVARETRPGPDAESDEALLAYLRASGQTSFHPVGSCKMGSDPMAVVDTDLRVHGIERLRVVDSSIMPTMPSSNTNAASIMVGERAADIILR